MWGTGPHGGWSTDLGCGRDGGGILTLQAAEQTQEWGMETAELGNGPWEGVSPEAWGSWEMSLSQEELENWTKSCSSDQLYGQAGL